MSLKLKIVLLLVSLWLFARTLKLVRENRIPIRYSLVWFLSALVLFVVSCFSGLFAKISSLIGFQVSSSLVIGIFIVFLLLITRMLTKVVSEQNKKITMLIQEVSLLKKEQKDNNK